MNIFLIISTFACLTFSMGNCKNFEDVWCTAVEDCLLKDYAKAEIGLTSVINDLRTNNDESYPNIYVDRGRLYMLQNKFQEALSDLNSATVYSNLSEKNLSRALISKIMIYANLNQEKDALKCVEELKALHPDFKKIEFTKDKVVLRNISDHEGELLKVFTISSKIYDDEGCVRMTNTGVELINANES